MDTSLSFVCFQGFIPKKLQRMDISLVAACMAMFFLYAASLSTDHQLLCSAFLSKNVTYIFFESTIASFYQSLCCGSPRGTMKICAMELDLQNSRILLPIKCFPLSLYARSLEIQTWKYILQRLYNLLARMFWTLMGWAKNVFCSGRWCEVPESICLIKPSYPLSMHYCITNKLDYCNSLLYGLPTIFTLINFKEFKMLLPDL